MSNHIKIGVIPTRRVDMSFPLERALYYKKEVYEKLKEMGIDYVDVEDCCADGIMGAYRESDAVIEKMRREKVDALFFPHVNFGCEGAVGQVSRAMNLPVLLWGPREATGMGDGDSQCGLFATGKIMRRMQAKFTYVPTCYVSDKLFEKGINTFLAISNVVKEFRRCRILQVSTRPESFWSVMCNEGELLEKFGIETFPISLTELVDRTLDIMKNEKEKVDEVIEELKRRTRICVIPEVVEKSAAMKIALERYAEETRSNCVAIQCWYALQQALGIWPCTAGSLLNESGLPVACETDIHGVISTLLADAASMGKNKTLFVDWVSRHPDRDKPNTEYIAHCGISSMTVFGDNEASIITRPHDFCACWGGHVSGQAMNKDVSFVRFDGDNGEYSLLLGTAKNDEGPDRKRGARQWVELPNLMKFEKHMVKGPYIHHAAVIHEDVTPVLYEACEYLNGLKPDFPFREQEEAAEMYLLTEEF